MSKRWRGAAKELVGARQDAGKLGEMAAAVFHAAGRHAQQAALEVEGLLAQLGADGHGEFGGGGGRGRAHIGGEVDQRGVGLMADGGDQRNLALERGTDDALFVEGHQVFDGAAPAGDDEKVGARQAMARGRSR